MAHLMPYLYTLVVKLEDKANQATKRREQEALGQERKKERKEEKKKKRGKEKKGRKNS